MANRLTITVEKNIPLPATRQTYPWDDLSVGDSFFVANRSLKTLRSLAFQYRRRTGMDKKFIAREEDGGVRVWRTK